MQRGRTAGPPPLLSLWLAAVILSGCSAGTGSPASSSSVTDAPSGDRSAGGSADCLPAPAWLVDAISEGIEVRGAYLSRVFMGPASAFTSGPAAVISGDAFRDAWWIAGGIYGAGVQPELGLWLTNRTAEPAAGSILAANAPARRYTRWGENTAGPISGTGSQAVIDCVGPLPKS